MPMSNAKKTQTLKEGLLATLPTFASEGDLAFIILVSSQIFLCPAETQTSMLPAIRCGNIVEVIGQNRICQQPSSEDVHER